MIGWLLGNVIKKYEQSLVLNVSGVGYLVNCSGKVLDSVEVSQDLELIIHTHMRENQLTLFGFLTEEEKAGFLMLQNIPGIGAKMALSVLGRFSIQDIQKIAEDGDLEALKSVSGIGAKMASRMLQELRGKPIDLSLGNMNSVNSDAVSALMGLGYSKQESLTALNSVTDKSAEIDEIIREALGFLKKK